MHSIKEVAKLAKVSPATVSRVINNKVTVSEEKRKRVLDAIHRLNFIPNNLAKSLYGKSSKLIGVVVPNIQNLYFSQMISIMEDEIYRRGYKIILCSSNNDQKKEIDNLNFLKSMYADGVILLSNGLNSTEYTDDFNIPFVILDREIEHTNKIINIECNHYKGIHLATKHLIKAGCKNIVKLAGDKHIPSVKKRIDSYLDICKIQKIEPKIIHIGFEIPNNISILGKIKSKYDNFDGIIASNDMTAMKVYRELIQNNFKIPDDVQIIGFDGLEICKNIYPQITTIAQPINEMAKYCVEALIEYIEGKKVYENKSKIFDVELMLGQTTKNN